MRFETIYYYMDMDNNILSDHFTSRKDALQWENDNKTKFDCMLFLHKGEQRKRNKK
jgi:hypothetical protein